MGSHHLSVGAGGKLALSPAVSINGYPTPLRIAGATGHGWVLIYDTATITLELEEDRWEAEFTDFASGSIFQGWNGSAAGDAHCWFDRTAAANREVKTLVLQESRRFSYSLCLARAARGPIVHLGAPNAKRSSREGSL